MQATARWNCPCSAYRACTNHHTAFARNGNLPWQEPDFDHDDYWMEVPWPAASALYQQLATMVVTGFRDGFRMIDPARLAYNAFNQNDGNRDLELPLLGLPRQD